MGGAGLCVYVFFLVCVWHAYSCRILLTPDACPEVLVAEAIPGDPSSDAGSGVRVDAGMVKIN